MAEPALSRSSGAKGVMGMRIGVIGTGHVGLVTCGTLAALGHEVVGTDSDHEKIDFLQHGVIPFHEPGLSELVADGVAAGRLRFTPDPADCLAGAEAVFICVGTPPRSTGEANLVAVERAAQVVALHTVGRVVVVEKSTVPAGTAQRVRRTLARERPDAADCLEVASNPEFLREGKAVEDSLHPDRILVGAEAPWVFEVMRRVYQPLLANGCRLIETDINTAELAKHACNAFLALKVSFANALARICERADADVVAVADVMGADARIGRSFLHAGLGYGGSCFPKDLQAFDRLSSKLGYDFPLLREIARINDEAVTATVEKIREGLWNLEDKRVALLGLSFKPGTDDIRFAPALALARLLIAEGAAVVGYDPQGMANAKEDLGELEVAPDPYEAAAGAHCVVLCTEWPEFLELDLDRLRSLMAYPLVVDGRNVFDPDVMRVAGFTYYPTGRARVE
jgi:UDPglucose 6-dehydrogenase